MTPEERAEEAADNFYWGEYSLAEVIAFIACAIREAVEEAAITGVAIPIHVVGADGVTVDLNATIAHAVEAEREACTETCKKLAERFRQDEMDSAYVRGYVTAALDAIEDIRSRSNKPAVTETGKKDDE